MKTLNTTTGAYWGKNQSNCLFSINGIRTMLKCVALLLAFLFVGGNDAWGATYTARNTGNWNARGMWVNNQNTMPNSGDNVTISSGRTVTVNTAANCNNCTLGDDTNNNNNGNITINKNQSLTVGATLTMNGSSSMTVNGTATIKSITANSQSSTIKGSGSLTINGGTLNCDLSGFTGTLKLDPSVKIGLNAKLPAGFSIEQKFTDCNGGAVNYSMGVTLTIGTNQIKSGTYADLYINDGVQATLCDNVTVTGNLTIKDGGTDTYITIPNGTTLTVNGNLVINNPTGNRTRNKYIEVQNGGKLIVNGDVEIKSSGNNQRDSYLLLNDGAIVTVGGNITMAGAGDITYIRFSGNGTLNLGGTITGGGITSTNGGGNNAPTMGTVVYSNTTTQQTVSAYSYWNLVLSTGNYIAGGGFNVYGNFKTDGLFDTNNKTIRFVGTTECGNGSIEASKNSSGNYGQYTYYYPTAEYIIKGNYRGLYFESRNNVSGNHHTCGDIEINGRAYFANDFGTKLYSDYNIDFKGGVTARNDAYIFASDGTTVKYGNEQNILPGIYYNLTTTTANKTLYGNVTVNGTLTWQGGNISLGTYDFTVNPNNISNKTYSNTHMFVCNGTANTGKLIFQCNNSADFTNLKFPIGTGTTYNMVTVNTATVSGGTGKIGFAEVPLSGSGNPTDLQRYWPAIMENVSGVDVTLKYYDGDVPTDVVENELLVSSFNGSEWNQCGGSLNDGSNTITATGLGSGCMGISALEPVKTFYSYKSGDWSNNNSWTLDPAGQAKKGDGVPGGGDRVIILNGDNITAEANGKMCKSLRIDDGGSLVLGTTTGHNFGVVSGQGRMTLASASFPAGNFSAFVASTGGTIEYQNTANFTLPATQTEYNNLILNFSGTNIVGTLASNITVNGKFTISKGTLKIGNDKNGRTMLVMGDFLVEKEGKITTGNTEVTNDTGAYLPFTDHNASDRKSTNRGHKLEIKGNFTNNGNVDFSNRTASNYDTNSSNKVDVYFTNESVDQDVIINGETKFYAIICDKGSDMTRVLNIDAQSTGLFHLYGYCYGRHYEHTGDFYLSLKIANGTLRLGRNIVIESLTGGHGSYGYKIDETACLWIDGANVKLYSGGYDSKALYVHGKLKMSNSASSFLVNTTDGMVNRNTADVEIEDGHLTASYIRTSLQSGTHIGSLTVKGGTLELNRSTNTQTGHATLSLTYPNNAFNMSGGEIIIHKANGAGFDIAIGCNPGNCNVTGGTVRLLCADGGGKNIISTAPFWNLEIGSVGGKDVTIKNFNKGDGSESIAIQPLVVLNDLTIKNGGTLNTGDQNIVVGHNFTIENGGTYNPGTNTTIFNGDGTNQNFTVAGTIGNNGLNNLTLAQGATLTMQNSVTVRSVLTLETGSLLYDNGKTLTVNGNINNSGTQFNSNSSAGSITLGGTNPQTIGGDGHGSFNNLVIANASTSVLSANTAVTGVLRLTGNNTKLNIGSYNLNLSDGDAIIYSNNADATAFSANKMIITSGLPSDGGITKQFSSTTEFLFPYGYDNYYLPARITIKNEPTSYGTVTSRPVKGKHYTWASRNDVLNCYWSNTSEGFEGVTAVDHIYQYVDGVVTLNTENGFYPGCYLSQTWSFIPNNTLVDKNNNRFTYNGTQADGDYTCGSQTALNTSPARLYSSSTPGDWKNESSWSSVGVGEAGGAGVPGSATIVYIGDETHQHTITVSDNNKSCGSLNIAKGSTLDLGTTNGHNFGMLPDASISGKGTLRISKSNYFPNGDFGAFLRADGGTVEYYAKSENITLPTTVATYNNLVIRSNNTYYVTMPNADIRVFGNLVSQGGADNNFNRFNTGANTRTLTIDGDLVVESGFLKFNSLVSSSTSGRTTTYTPRPQNVVVNGNVKVNSDATFSTKANGNNWSGANQITIYGNMDVDGTLDFTIDTRYVATTFAGTRNDTIRGAGTIKLYSLTCDKGTDATPVLYLEKEISTSGTAFLDLKNGTFRANGDGLEVTIIDNAEFEIPATACLSTQKGKFILENTGNKDITLSGKIEVLGGEMVIGNGTNGNDIEIAGGGEPEIDVQGGKLTVNGQIRRNTDITLGSLTYRQSGGEVLINGKGRDNSRALLEITNNGKFITSGGQLTFAGGGGSTEQFGDVLITPAECEVTGGTIQIGDSDSDAGQTFHFNANPAIFNLTVGASGASQNVELKTNALNMLGTLTINSGSQFKANGFNVTIGGDIVNNNADGNTGIECGGYWAGSETQITTLNGSANQTIYGDGNNTINFAYLTINSSATVSLNGIDVNANNDLHIAKGSLDDAGNEIHVKKNVINDATHKSSVAGGGIIVDGYSSQLFKSTSGKLGTYGNFTVVNSLSLNDNIQVEGNINLQNVLNISNYHLLMGENSGFSGSFGPSAMIELPGAIGDLGVRRMLADGFTGNIYFPIGRAGLYTPAEFNISAFSGNNAFVNVKVISNRHVSTVNTPTGSVDSYWRVTTSGVNSVTVSHNYTYVDDDLMAGTDESLLEAKRYFDNDWTNYSDGEYAIADNVISIPGLTYFDGEYTAGYYGYSCQPKMRSKKSGRWGDSDTWEKWDATTSSWVATTSAPNGNEVTICNGHEVTIEGDGKSAYSINIEQNAKLIVGKTLLHSLGLLSGGGTISLTALDPVSTEASSFKLPAADYTEFFNNVNSTIIFDNGNHNATLREQPGNYYKPFNNVEFTGTGKTTVTALSFYAKGNVTIHSGCHLDNATNNRPFYIGGNLIDENTGETGYICGTSQVIFNGTSPQTVTLGTDAKFYDLKILNATGVTLAQGDIEVGNKLTLETGNFITKDDALIRLTSTNTAVVVGGSTESFVDGPLSKNISNGSSFVFPVGDNGRYGNITLSNTSGAGYWTAQYFNDDPSSSVGSSFNSPISSISDNEYWTVTRPTGATAKVGLRWDKYSTPYSDFAMLKSRLQLAEYGNNVWDARTASVGNGSNVESGVITTTSNVAQDEYIFTLAYTGVAASITTTDTQSICNDGEASANVEITISGEQPWTLKYQISDGVNVQTKTLTGITSSPHTLTFVGSDLGANAGTYTISLVSVSDKSEEGIVSSNEATIEVLKTYTPSITGSAISGTTEKRPYSVEAHEGSTYDWSWEGTSGGTINKGNTASIEVSFGGTTGTFVLKVTEKSVDGCEMSNTLEITVNNKPSPSFVADDNICSSDVLTYSTDATGGNYAWTLDGVAIGSDSPSVTIDWTTKTVGDHTIKIKQTRNGVSGEFEKTVTVFQKPASQTIADIPVICSGNIANVTLNGSDNNVTYYLYSDADKVLSQATSGTGNALTIKTLDKLSATTNVYVAVTNTGCNFEQNNYTRIPDTGTETITVNESPAITFTMPDLYVGAPSDMEYTVTSTSQPVKYSIDYTAGGVDVAETTLGKITFIPTASQLTGTFTIVADNNCPTSYDFDETTLSDYVWSGKVSAVWDEAGNWYSGKVPTENDDIIIRFANNNQPKVQSTSAVAKTVRIESSSTLTMDNNSKLAVYGDWIKEDGAFFTCNTSTVAFNGTTNVSGQTTFHKVEITGTLNAGSDLLTISGDVVNNGTFNGSETGSVKLESALALNGSGAYNFTNIETTNDVEANANLNIAGALTLTSGVIKVADGKTVAFGGSASASASSGAYINGTVTKQGSSEFTFPIGNNGVRAMIGVTPETGASSSTIFTVVYSYVPTDDHSRTDDHPDLEHVSKEETWNVSCNDNTPSYLTLYWENGERSGITDLTSLVVAHKVGDKWEDVGVTATGGNSTSGWIKSGLVTSYSPFTFGSKDSNTLVNPLPVTFVNFTGKAEGNAILLEWTTMSELNNEHFEIERSVDGKNFVTVGYVEGAGLSSEKIDYRFYDNSPEYGYQYYRLFQVDYNGVKSYADQVIRVLFQDTEEDRMTIAPNPSDGQFRISVNSNIADGTVQIMSQSGKVVRMLDLDGVESSIDITDLSNGIYFLRYISNSKVFQQKIVKF